MLTSVRSTRRTHTRRRTIAAVVGLAAAVTPGLVGSSTADAAPALDAAEQSGPATLDRTLLDDRITESSGLDRSTQSPGVLLTHNDSGDGPRVFAVGDSGQTEATWTLGGASANDWEDIATGPAHTVWVGDIGDNAKQRDTVQVYRFTEPGALTDTTVAAERFELDYPDGSHDAETLMVHPTTGRLMIATKSQNGAAFYQAPAQLNPNGVNHLVKVAEAPPILTAGAIGPDGNRLAVRDYFRIYLYDLDRLDEAPRTLDAPPAGQAESLTFNRLGTGLLVGSEGPDSPVLEIPL